MTGCAPTCRAIDAVLCSTATRARETLERSGIDAPVRYVDRLYGATAGTVIEEINKVSDDVSTLLVVGHEPTTSEVAIILAGADGTDTVALERISEKYPTSSIAVLRDRRRLGAGRTGQRGSRRLPRTALEGGEQTQNRPWRDFVQFASARR